MSKSAKKGKNRKDTNEAVTDENAVKLQSESESIPFDGVLNQEETTTEGETPPLEDETGQATPEIDIDSQETSTSSNDTELQIMINENGEAVAVPVKKKVTFKSVCRGIKSFFERLGFPNMLLLRFMTVYFLFSGMNISEQRKEEIYAIGNWKGFIPEIEVGKSLLLMSCVFFILTVFHSALPPKLRVIDQLTAIASIIYFAAVSLWKINDFYICMGTMLVSMVFIYYALGKLPSKKFLMKVHWSISGIIALALAIMVCIFVAITTIYKHKIFGTSCFDFGIFVQMYHSLAENLTAVTTCERDKALSHFYIHSSFIYYILLPIYKLYPKEETLFIAQAVFAMGGVIPMFFIAKNHKFKGIPLLFLTLGYVFCAAIIGPCYYDFHENAFLPTLLMWLIWSIDRKKYIPMYIFSILVCIVKEDAPLYVVCIGMYFFFREKGYLRRINGLIISVVSGVYMVIITKWLTENGDGQFMTSTRFGNLLIDPEGGLVEVVKNVLTDPSYFFSLLIKEGTIMFFVEVMLPILFMPFVTKKISRFLLMIPFIITNLVVGAGYGYAANIGYQYIFGPMCLLLYMAIINLDDLGLNKKHDFSILIGSASFILSFGLFTGHFGTLDSYKAQEDYFKELEAMLDEIPKDASVAADTFLLPHVADRDEVYILDTYDFALVEEENSEGITEEGENTQEKKYVLTEPERYDFFVCSPSMYNEYGKYAFEEEGIFLFDEIPGRIRIYQSPRYEENK